MPANGVVAGAGPEVRLFGQLDNSLELRMTLSTGRTTRDTSEQIALAGQSGVVSTKFRSGVGYPDTASTLSRMPSMPARISPPAARDHRSPRFQQAAPAGQADQRRGERESGGPAPPKPQRAGDSGAAGHGQPVQGQA